MRIRMSFRPVVAAAVSIGVLAAASTASAAAPTGQYAPFKYCPYTNTNVASCLKSTATAGSFKLGNATVPLSVSTPTILQGGYGFTDTGNVWYNAAQGGKTLDATPLKVPGGLLGLVNTGGWSGVLIDLFNAAVASVNDVYATAELAGNIQFSYLNFVAQFNSPAIVLPIKVHLENPFLGSNCYIGSNSNPIVLNLTTGTTSPPAPNTPISGSRGDLQSSPDTYVLTATNNKLVDNSFSVPAASNCGYLLLDRILITAAVNLKEGLPSAAGNNSAILQGTSQIGDRAQVQASVS
jgi:hypothetical protein